MRIRYLLTSSILLGGLTATAGLPGSLITFEELSERRLDGVSLKGVTFGFFGEGRDIPEALFGTTLLSFGETLLMDAPWAAGPSVGVMTLEFDAPIESLSFNVGLATTLSLPAGCSVYLSSGSELIASIHVPTEPLSPSPFAFSEGRLTWAEAGRTVTTATIAFDTSASENFALDNLAFTVIPEPTTFALLGLGALAFACWRRGGHAAQA